MKKIIVLLSVLFLLILPQNAVFGGESQFDYSKYLAPEAYRAIKESQGILLVIVPTFSQPETTFVQALAIDAEKRLIITVAHMISKYPSVAFSEETAYSFIFQGKTLSAKLKHLDKDADLAIFELQKGENFPQLKAVKFSKSVEPFVEYYALDEDLGFYEGIGFYVRETYPYRGCLVGKYSIVKMIPTNPLIAVPLVYEYLTFDKPIKRGFSGAGLFNKKSEAIGIFRGFIDGYSVAISVETILRFLEEYKTSENK